MAMTDRSDRWADKPPPLKKKKKKNNNNNYIYTLQKK